MCDRYVDEIGSVDDPSLSSPGDAPVLVCISEAPLGGMATDERVLFGLIAVTPSTGEVVWDDFEDGFMRSEIEVKEIFRCEGADIGLSGFTSIDSYSTYQTC